MMKGNFGCNRFGHLGMPPSMWVEPYGYTHERASMWLGQRLAKNHSSQSRTLNHTCSCSNAPVNHVSLIQVFVIHCHNPFNINVVFHQGKT